MSQVRGEPRIFRLVCEGVCNPLIRDFDVAAGRVYTSINTPGPDREHSPSERRDIDRRKLFVADMARTLKHTNHTESTGEQWSDVPGRGWVRKWRCVDCGHIREF